MFALPKVLDAGLRSVAESADEGATILSQMLKFTMRATTSLLSMN